MAPLPDLATRSGSRPRAAGRLATGSGRRQSRERPRRPQSQGRRRGRVSPGKPGRPRPTGREPAVTDLLLEIGVEELPASFVPPALEQLERGARQGLEELRLGLERVETFATPRRLALLVRGLAARQSSFEEEVLGPAARVAYDAQGAPTAALLGFCRSKGLEAAAVRRVETPRGEYVAATLRHAGRPALAVLPGWLSALATGLQFPKSMRWLTHDETRFARPVRWLVALLGERVVPVTAFGLTAGRRSFGHRFLHGGPVEVRRASDYLRTLARASVVADHRARAEELSAQLEAEARRAGGRVVPDPELVEINNFMVERPTAFAGRFDPRHLELPREVVVTALREHQRFFAVEDSSGALLPVFVAVRNGDRRGMERVRRGAEDVLAARLEDARFYWQTDLQLPPAERVGALAGVVWLEGLGTLADKARRLESLAGWLAERLAPEVGAAARRAALLCKTDLLSEMIGSGKEYASLEGIVGSHYARLAGEPEAVVQAIAEHYRPRGPADALPAGAAGAVLSLADKLDHVAGAFVAGKIPSGSEDPYGVRRAGNAAVRILIEQRRHLDLRDATMEATRPFLAADPDLPQAAIVKKLGEFWRSRVEAALEERGAPYDTREAALEAQVPLDGAERARPGWIDPWDCWERARVLSGFRSDPRFESLVILFRRVGNILRAATEPLTSPLDRARLAEPAERELMAALESARGRTQPLWDRRAYADILPVLLDMEQAIHGFFDRVLVNVEDAPTRVNRLRLLTEVRALFLRGWDLSRVVVEGEKS